MYIIQHTAFLVLLLHQCIVNGFNIFNIDTGFNYHKREMNSISSPSELDTEIETRWILQELDHFNSSDKRMFQMKYVEGIKYWRENGPIYIFMDKRTEYTPFFIKFGIMNELAIETHGAMFVTEHRYYGDSKPFDDLDAENIKYLSSRQALADVAKLINYLKSLPMYRDSKVVVIGDYNTAHLAAWMKVLYPELIDAAIASGARVLAQKDSFEYLEKVKNNVERYGGTECLNNITKLISNYDLLFQSSEGIKQLKKEEHICDSCDMTVIENKQLFFLFRTTYFSFISSDVRSLQDYCASNKDKNIYSSFFKKNLKGSSDENCYNFDFQELINHFRDHRNTEYLYTKLYQACTEFGQFPTTSSKNQPFLNIPLEFFIKICSGFFGNNFNEKRVDKGVEYSNKLYGGLKPNVTNVVFTNGYLDPWSTLSVLKDLSHDAPALVIPRAYPGQELSPERNEDSEELKEARAYIKYLIKKWIGVGEYLN